MFFHVAKDTLDGTISNWNCFPFASTCVHIGFILVGYVYWSSSFFLCCDKKMFVVVALLDFVLCILFPMVQVFLDCQVLFALRFSLKGLLKILLYLIHYNYEGVKYYIHAKTKEASAQTKYWSLWQHIVNGSFGTKK